MGLELERATGEPFVWLCVTNSGARHVCMAALKLLGLGQYLGKGYPTDPNHGESQLFYASPGVVVRLTRNQDKDRGFVNGAVGVVRRILSYDEDNTPTVFTVELSSGVLVLVHPIKDKKQTFLPCTYGYATTIRRAQGATYLHGGICFDHVHPPERGYGYVAASRFKSKKGIHLYGKIRRTDWLPVRHSAKAMQHDQVERSEESMSEYDSSDDEAMFKPRDYDGASSMGDKSESSERDFELNYEEALKDYEFSFKKDMPDIYANPTYISEPEFELQD